jgi:uncharacterized protein YoxC
MENNLTLDEMYQKAIQFFGKVAQLEKTTEELTELRYEIWEYLQRGAYDINKLLSERADVGNMLKQLDKMCGFTKEQIEAEMVRKMERTMVIIDKERGR